MIESVSQVANIKIGRIKDNPVSLTLFYKENGSPKNIDQEIVWRIFDSGSNRTYISKEADLVEGNLATFTLTEEEKQLIVAQKSATSITIDGTIIALGTFEWAPRLSDQTTTPPAIGIDFITEDGIVQWTQMIIGPRGKDAYLYAVEHGYEGTEEEYGEFLAQLPKAKQNAEKAKIDAEQAASIASEKAGEASSSALAASQSKENAIIKAQEAWQSALAAAQSLNNIEGHSLAAYDSATTAEQKATEATEASNQAKTAAQEAQVLRDQTYNLAYIAGFGSPLWYGVEINTAASSTVLTRIGNMEMHRELPIQSKIRHCLLKDNGEVNYYTHSNNQALKQSGLTALLDGTDGQREVEIPESYWRIEVEGMLRRIKVSEMPLPGFFRVPKFYVSPDGACMQRSTGKLASVVNTTADYRGGNNNATWDSQSRSLLGKEVSSISLTQARDAARLRGPGWESYNILAHHVISWLIRIEYANLNVQLPFNADLTTDGFRQGGLGNGVTTLNNSLWSSWNNSNPFLPVGLTTSLGNGSGVVPYSMPTEYSSPAVQIEVPVWRGIANPFGYLWRWVDGVLFNVQSDAAGGKTLAYATYDPSLFSSNNFSQYDIIGEIPRVSGFITQLHFNDLLAFLPAATGGSSATYYADQIYTSFPGSGTEIRGCMVGGWAVAGANGGVNCLRMHDTPNTSNQLFSTRLCFFPEHPLLS